MGYNRNIRITTGSSIPVPEKQTEWNYVHMRLSFDQVECLESLAGPNESDISSMREALEGRSAALYIDKIGADLEYGVNVSGYNIINNANEANQYANMPCGIKTRNGSIIPHPILPDENFMLADNGLLFGSDSSQSPAAGGYGWTAVDVRQMCNVPSTSAAQAYASSIQCYGNREEYKYLSNVGTEGLTDVPIKCVRGYNCNLSSATAGHGACAICYRVCNYEPILNDTVDAAGNSGLEAPYVEFAIGARKYGEAATVYDGKTSTYVNNNSHAVRIKIQARGGGTEVSVGKGEVREASFPVSENDIYPPQCRPGVDGGMQMNVMYVYPTYYGVVVTNSITKAGSSGTSEVLVRGPGDGSRCPWNNLSIKDENNNDYYTAYAKDYLKNNKGSDLEFFPTTLHETSQISGIHLRMNDNGSVVFNSSMQAVWSRCVGYWAYCPLYFHRNLSFRMYFKAPYAGSGQTDSFGYWAYPLVKVDPGSSDTQWTGMTKKGATCIKAVKVIDDTELMESIYKIEFKFTSSSMLRFPIEVFGVEIVMRRKEFQFTHRDGNGKFRLCETNGAEGSGGRIREQYTRARTLQGTSNLHLGLITNLSVTTSIDGVSGSMELDGYPIEQGIAVIRQTQSIGELDLAVDLPSSDDPSQQDSNNPHPTIFRGYGMEIATAGTDGDYRMSVKLEGVQKKMSDMSLVCAPFWDGDRLEAICLYFEQYMKLKLRMIGHNANSYSDAKEVSSNMFAHSGNWVSKDAYTKSKDDVDGVNDNAFRVPRSFNWMSPAVNFQTGTSCLEALKKLGELTSCVFVVGANGAGYFYELNEYGCPYYVKNQIDNGNYVEFSVQEIVSINMAPTYENWHNSIATFGFIRKFTVDAAIKPVSSDNVSPGINYTKTSSSIFPWSKHNVGVENGFLTKAQLKKIHNTRVRFSQADRYQGTITVLGNTRVNHMYQVIKINGVYYYVLQISHSIDLGRKSWTTSYQIAYFQA